MEAKSKKFLFENCFQDDMPQKNDLMPVKSSPRRTKKPPRRSKTPPRRPPDVPRRPKTPQDARMTPPRHLQDASKTPPRRPQDDTKSSQNAPRCSQDAPRCPRTLPRRQLSANWSYFGSILDANLFNLSILEHLGARPGIGSLRFGRAGFRVALARRAPALRAQYGGRACERSAVLKSLLVLANG